MLFTLFFWLAVVPSIFGATLRNAAVSAPTAGPSKSTGKLPALGYALIYYSSNNPRHPFTCEPQLEYLERIRLRYGWPCLPNVINSYLFWSCSRYLGD
jgi:hypothetical protein